MKSGRYNSVGTYLVSHHTAGQITRYGGWYMARMNAKSVWRILLAGSQMQANGDSVVLGYPRVPPPCPGQFEVIFVASDVLEVTWGEVRAKPCLTPQAKGLGTLRACPDSANVKAACDGRRTPMNLGFKLLSVAAYVYNSVQFPNQEDGFRPGEQERQALPVVHDECRSVMDRTAVSLSNDDGPVRECA